MQTNLASSYLCKQIRLAAFEKVRIAASRFALLAMTVSVFVLPSRSLRWGSGLHPGGEYPGRQT